MMERVVGDREIYEEWIYEDETINLTLPLLFLFLFLFFLEIFM